uniref:Uncharacterized protein n=1 Tax=Ananas comosus var. bracteatus TaxID=296719 RepID=A0A6V7NSL4_ANACO|nr:unnamed protein product [Ananas comosus var. bracteatus]
MNDVVDLVHLIISFHDGVSHCHPRDDRLRASATADNRSPEPCRPRFRSSALKNLYKPTSRPPSSEERGKKKKKKKKKIKGSNRGRSIESRLLRLHSEIYPLLHLFYSPISARNREVGLALDSRAQSSRQSGAAPSAAASKPSSAAGVFFPADGWSPAPPVSSMSGGSGGPSGPGDMNRGGGVLNSTANSSGPSIGASSLVTDANSALSGGVGGPTCNGAPASTRTPTCASRPPPCPSPPTTYRPPRSWMAPPSCSRALTTSSYRTKERPALRLTLKTCMLTRSRG